MTPVDSGALATREFPQILHENGKLVSCHNGTSTLLQAGELPRPFIRWQTQARQDAFSELSQKRTPRFMHAHLPVLATVDQRGPFGINLANKGVGMTPLDQELPKCAERVRSAIARATKIGWEDSLLLRIEVANEIYANPKRIDPRRLVGLEIFEGRTFENLANNPKCSFLFTGTGPAYESYQIDCVAQIVVADDPLYEFALAMRELFARDRFHIRQTAYPYGYVFWVSSVADKRPRGNAANRRRS